MLPMPPHLVSSTDTNYFVIYHGHENENVKKEKERVGRLRYHGIVTSLALLNQMIIMNLHYCYSYIVDHYVMQNITDYQQ